MPRLLRHPTKGLIFEGHRAHKYGDIVVFTASRVFATRLPLAELDTLRVVDYPGGMEAAANRFLHPALGIAKVEPSAIHCLSYALKENTMSKKDAVTEPTETQGKRGSGTLALMREHFAKLLAKGGSRADAMRWCEEKGFNLKTAATQWQAARKAAGL